MEKLYNIMLILLLHPGHALAGLVRKLWFLIPDDKLYLKIIYRLEIGHPLDLKNPKSYTEKMQWLKLYNRNPDYTTMVDKIAVKEYVAGIIGEEYIIPTLGVWNHFEEINFDKLPNQFVLKTNHGGGGSSVFICKNKKDFDKKFVCKKIEAGLMRNCYNKYREWPYKNVKPKILAEEYIQESDGDLRDYKVLCFNGIAKLVEFHQGRYLGNHTQDFYDRDWNKTDITQGSYGESSKYIAERPIQLEKIIDLSEKLSAGIPHVRVDWYIVNNVVYFGELTFFDGSGLEPWDRYEDDLLMGSWITLPEKTVEPRNKEFGVQGIDMFY